MLVPYGIGKLAALRVLLRREQHGLGAVYLVDFVDSGVELSHAVVAQDVEGEEIGLYGCSGHYAYEQYSGTLVVDVGAIDAVQAGGGCLDDVDGGRRRGGEVLLGHVGVLLQFGPEMVGVDKHAHDAGCRLLLAQLLGAACSEVGYVGAQRLEVVHHAVEAAACADALLACREVVGYAVDGVEFGPRALYDYVVECGVYPCG